MFKKIKPESVMIYTYQRDTAAKELIKISKEELNKIGKRIEGEGFTVEVSA